MTPISAAPYLQINKNDKENEGGVKKLFVLYFSMDHRDFSVKSKLIISLFQTVKVSL